MTLQRFAAVLIGRNREFLRDRSSLAWNILFPVFIVFGFAFAFSEDSLELYKVGVLEPPDETARLAFMDTRYVQFISVDELAEAVAKVERHRLDMLIAPSEGRYWINDTSPRGYILERVLQGSGGEGLVRQSVSGSRVRYADWLIPGVLAMNMMFSALFGVGYVIVRYRKNGVLKRLKATPLTAFEFLAAQVASRLWLIVSITTLIFTATEWLIGFRVFGSHLNLLIVFTLGAISLISLGLMVAARTASEELAGGLLNMITWPMMFLSGVWFSLEGLHPLLQKLALILPLTHVIEGARAIMIDGAGLLDVAGHLIALIGMSGLFLSIGAYTFRWE
jgi:ABC-type multidrug transport system permease subunit